MFSQSTLFVCSTFSVSFTFASASVSVLSNLEYVCYVDDDHGWIFEGSVEVVRQSINQHRRTGITLVHPNESLEGDGLNITCIPSYKKAENDNNVCGIRAVIMRQRVVMEFHRSIHFGFYSRRADELFTHKTWVLHGKAFFFFMGTKRFRWCSEVSEENITPRWHLRGNWSPPPPKYGFNFQSPRRHFRCGTIPHSEHHLKWRVVFYFFPI